MNIRFHEGLRMVLMLFIVPLAAISANAQTSGELRKKYGKPEIIRLKNGRPEVERYVVRPDIMLTITYTKDGRACELLIEPVASSTTASDFAGPRMPTEVVISIINELVPITSRGELVSVFVVNGGDPKMKLHHPGCTGIYIARYKHVSINNTSWCKGGTFSAAIHWEDTDCPGQKIQTKNKR